MSDSSPDTELFNSGHPMKIGDVEYTASRFTDKDYGDLSEYIRGAYLANAYSACKLLPELEKRDLLKIALSEVTNISWGTPEGENIIFSTEGAYHLGFQLIHRRHAKVTYEKFKEECEKSVQVSIDMIYNTYSYLMLPKKEDGTGGSSTENNKSE